MSSRSSSSESAGDPRQVERVEQLAVDARLDPLEFRLERFGVQQRIGVGWFHSFTGLPDDCRNMLESSLRVENALRCPLSASNEFCGCTGFQERWSHPEKSAG